MGDMITSFALAEVSRVREYIVLHGPPHPVIPKLVSLLQTPISPLRLKCDSSNRQFGDPSAIPEIRISGCSLTDGDVCPASSSYRGNPAMQR
jgi:hypothetical protein